jgi:hypothetical protein
MKEEVPVEAVEGAEKQEPEVIKEKKEVPAEGEVEQVKEGKESKVRLLCSLYCHSCRRSP